MPRPDVSEERRPQIIQAALRLFSRQGYRKTTMPDVAREAGLSVGGIYWYYQSKEALVLAIAGQIFQGDLALLRSLLHQDAPVTERLRAYAAQTGPQAAELRWLTVTGIQFYAEAQHDEKIRAFIQQYLAQYRTVLAELIAQGVARGEFRPVDPLYTANLFLILVEGLGLLESAGLDQADWATTFQLGMELLLAGLSV